MNELERIDFIFKQVNSDYKRAYSEPESKLKAANMREVFGMVRVLTMLVKTGNPTPLQLEKSDELYDSILSEIFPSL